MQKSRYRLPSTSALTAFEAAARYLNFSRAADELHTSQSAISRHIASLEQRLGVPLFVREKRRLRLTEQGEQLVRAVISGFDNIQSAIAAIRTAPPETEITIACTHEISHLYLMPRFEALQNHLGPDVQIHILTSEYDALESHPDPRIDLAFSYGTPMNSVYGASFGTPSISPAGETAPDSGISQPSLIPSESDSENFGTSTKREAVVTVFEEAVCPVCAPQFALEHAKELNAGVEAWQNLPFLLLIKPNKGWATWNDWFDKVGASGLSPRFIGIDNYVYLLEACMAGRGIALAWRGLIDRYLEAGTLQACTTEFVEMDQALRAYLTPAGRAKELTWLCLNYFRDESQ